jgi:hypothetical protein
MSNAKYRELIVGFSATGKHGVYLEYGEASADEEREMSQGGHEEILFQLGLEAHLINSGMQIPIAKEEAVSFNQDASFTFVAQRDCRYEVWGKHIAPHWP